MQTLDDRVLSQDELRTLSARSNRAGAIRLALHAGLLGLAGWWVAAAEGWALWPAMLALGLVQVALFAPSHETMHQTAFTSQRANLIIGWITFLPALQSSHFYAAFHYIHHRHTNVPGQDPELIAPPPATLAQYLLRIAGVNYWMARAVMIRDAWRGDMSGHPYINARQMPGVIASVRAMSLTVAGAAIAAGLIWGWPTPFLFWIIPQMLGQPFLRGYLLAEHTGCTLDRNGLTNTRTTLTNRFVRLLMWDMPFHAEHHLYPSIPFHRLDDAHRLIGDKLGFLQPGYARWNLGFMRGLARR
ncbi:MAG: fatty acid desaturase [Alphaproteobacteria bacterium]|nr:fatty acid desaturase [Alphaproteobacteria bacterium]